MKIAAFFDFDGTLLPHNSTKLGLVHLWRQGHVSSLFLSKLFVMNKLCQLGVMEQERALHRSASYFKNREMKTIQTLQQAIYEQHVKPVLSASMLELIEHHRRSGHCLVLLTAQARYSAEIVARDLRFDHVLCSDLEVDARGIGTGRFHGPICIGESKAISAREFARSQGISLADSYAYADEAIDEPILSAVGHPVAVAPKPGLLRIARERGWLIKRSHEVPAAPF